MYVARKNVCKGENLTWNHFERRQTLTFTYISHIPHVYSTCYSTQPYRLEHDFLDYLDEWEASAQAAENAEKNKLCISRETLEGLRMTGLCTGFVKVWPLSIIFFNVVMSMVELIPFPLRIKGVKYVLTEKFCQDPLESFFGKQRMHGGANDNPTVATLLKNTVSLRLQGSVALKPVRGNCRRGKGKRNHCWWHTTPQTQTCMCKATVNIVIFSYWYIITNEFEYNPVTVV